jgi:sortase A
MNASFVALVMLLSVVALLVYVVRQRAATVGAPATAGAVAAPGAAAPTDTLGRLVHGLRRRRWLRRTLSLLSVAAAVVGIGMLAYPFYTNLYQSRLQSRLDRELASPELREKYQSGALDEGDSLTRIKIASIGVDMVVVEGTSSSALRAGAGHYPETALPCETGNVAIAGHRTTYGKPFHNLDLVKPGDKVVLETPVGSCTYVAQQAPFIIAPTDYGVVAPTQVPTLTLTTCHPKGSAAQRLVLQAVLEGQPVQA